MGTLPPAASIRRLPQVLGLTIVVVGLPVLAISLLRAAGLVTSFFLLAAIGTALSLLVSGTGATLWSRQPGAADAVFDDLLLWGWWRRRRQERRLAGTAALLRLQDGPGVARFPAEQQSVNRQVWQLEKLAAALEARHPGLQGHSRRVARHATAIAKRMRLHPTQVATIRTAAAIHDIGKVETPVEILSKPGRLTDEEFAHIRQHAVTGARLVEGIGSEELTQIVRHHHERVDGNGYPSGLRGEQIPIGARIIAVADTFDAVTSRRPYRDPMRHREALELLSTEAGAQLDADAVKAFRSYYAGRQPVTIWALALNGPRQLLVSLASELKFGGLAVAAKATAATGAAVAAGSVAAGSLGVQPGTGAGGATAVQAARHSVASAPAIGSAGEQAQGPPRSKGKGRDVGTGVKVATSPAPGVGGGSPAPEVSVPTAGGQQGSPASAPGSGAAGAPPSAGPAESGDGAGAPGSGGEGPGGGEEHGPASEAPAVPSLPVPQTAAVSHVVETVASTPASETAVEAVQSATQRAGEASQSVGLPPGLAGG